MCAFHLEFVELYILLQSTMNIVANPILFSDRLCCLLMLNCLIVKSHQKGACTKVHILNHPASTFSCGAVYIPMSVVGMPLPSAGPNAVCGSVHIIMHLQPNTSCPPAPSPAQRQQLGFHQSNPVQVEGSLQSAAADQDYQGGILWQTNDSEIHPSNTMSAFSLVCFWAPHTTIIWQQDALTRFVVDDWTYHFKVYAVSFSHFT